MIILATTLIIGLLFLFFISSLRTSRDNDLEEYETELNEAITSKQLQLASMVDELQYKATDKDTKLPLLVIEVLDIYEKSNIRIPVDIIEELSSNRLYTPHEVYTFIEQQRNNWKLENSKRPYKKVKIND